MMSEKVIVNLISDNQNKKNFCLLVWFSLLRQALFVSKSNFVKKKIWLEHSEKGR